MDRNRSHDSLTSLSLAALVAAAFCAAPVHAAAFSSAGLLDGIRADGWQGIPTSAPPTAAAPRTSPTASRANVAPAPQKTLLSEAQIQTLLKLNTEHGNDMTLDVPMTDALGLTANGAKLRVRQLGIVISPELTHSYMRLNDGGFLLGNVHPTDYKAYLANARQELVGAVWYQPGKAPVVLSVAAAQKELGEELAFWIYVADNQ